MRGLFLFGGVQRAELHRRTFAFVCIAKKKCNMIFFARKRGVRLGFEINSPATVYCVCVALINVFLPLFNAGKSALLKHNGKLGFVIEPKDKNLNLILFVLCRFLQSVAYPQMHLLRHNSYASIETPTRFSTEMQSSEIYRTKECKLSTLIQLLHRR
jgi:hypothetical protein